MKKILTIGYVLFTALLLSCEKSLIDKDGLEYEAVLSELDVSETSLEVSSEEQTKSIRITCNSYWTVSLSSSWLTIRTLYGRGDSSLTLQISANPSTTQKRTAVFVVSDGINQITVSVVQSPAKEYLSLSENALNFTYDSGSAGIDVVTNADWSATSSASWCTVSTTSSRITVNVRANDSYSSRSATVTVTSSSSGTTRSISQNITVNQSAAKEPTVGSLSVSDITKTSATCKFTFNSADLNVQRSGVCYSTKAKEPTISDTFVYSSVSSRSGTSNLYLPGLTQNALYYVRPYVTTSVGITYGKTVQFTTAKVISPEEGDNPTPGY